MPTDAFLVLLFLLMGVFYFPSFSKICSESNRLEADQSIHQPLIWPTSQVLAMMSVTDFISQISSTSLEVLIYYSIIHTANTHAYFSLKGIMIKFSLEEEKG